MSSSTHVSPVALLLSEHIAGVPTHWASLAVRHLAASTLAIIVTGCPGRAPPGADAAAYDASDLTDLGPSVLDGDAGPSCVRGPLPDVWLRDPPPLPSYSRGVCPVLRGGPSRSVSRNDGFATGTQSRAFYLLVPSWYAPDRAMPMVLAWHWLAGDATQMIAEAQLEAAVEQLGFIAVVPEALRDADSGMFTYAFDWPFAEAPGQEPELQFFDDLLACVTSQYNVDRRRIHAFGVSAGALWLTFLTTTPRVDHLASTVTVSGGLGQQRNVLALRYVPQDNKFPAIVLWGGPQDRFLIDFERASTLYRDELRCDHHFVIQCVHDAGHAVPAIDMPDGGTRFGGFWQFLFDHPYGLGPDQSPYLDGGLPGTLPTWCSTVP